MTNTFWHLSSEPSNRPLLADTPGFVSGTVEIVRVGVDEVRASCVRLSCDGVFVLLSLPSWLSVTDIWFLFGLRVCVLWWP